VFCLCCCVESRVQVARLGHQRFVGEISVLFLFCCCCFLKDSHYNFSVLFWTQQRSGAFYVSQFWGSQLIYHDKTVSPEISMYTPNVVSTAPQHRSVSDANIFAFSCNTQNQIEDCVPMFCKKIVHFWGLEKLLNTFVLLLFPLVVFLCFKRGLFSQRPPSI